MPPCVDACQAGTRQRAQTRVSGGTQLGGRQNSWRQGYHIRMGAVRTAAAMQCVPCHVRIFVFARGACTCMWNASRRFHRARARCAKQVGSLCAVLNGMDTRWHNHAQSTRAALERRRMSCHAHVVCVCMVVLCVPRDVLLPAWPPAR